MINFIPYRIFRDPLFHKPVTGQELFFAVSYSKPVLVKKCLFQIDAYMFWPNLIKKSVTVSKCLRYKLTPTRLTCTLKSNTTLYPKNNKDKL